MAKRRKEVERFPETVIISSGGPPNSPYLTLHKDGLDGISRDTVVGVYKLKRVSMARVKRKLERLE